MNIKLIYTALIILLAGCEDDAQPKTELEKLPPATQEGKNTFGCLVDGKAWAPKTSTKTTSFYQDGVLWIAAIVKDANFDQEIYIYIYDENLSEKKYLLWKKVDQYSNNAGLSDKKNNSAFETSSEYTGAVTITHLDQSHSKWIVSGTFNLKHSGRFSLFS